MLTRKAAADHHKAVPAVKVGAALDVGVGRKQWHEKDEWWRAVMASEELRAECTQMRRTYSLGGRMGEREVGRMPQSFRYQWSQLNCAALD